MGVYSNWKMRIRPLQQAGKGCFGDLLISFLVKFENVKCLILVPCNVICTTPVRRDSR